MGQFPEAIELTFSRKNLHDQNLINNKDYPIKNLDFPNSNTNGTVKNNICRMKKIFILTKLISFAKRIKLSIAAWHLF